MTSRSSLATLSLISLLVAACADAESREAGELEPIDEPMAHVEIDADRNETPATAARPDDDVRTPAGEETPAEPEPAPPVLAAGTQITFRLSENVSTETHSAGDPFRGTVTEAVEGPGGVVLPAGAEMIGTVRLASPSEGPEDDATLVLAIERIEIDGEPTPVIATMVEADVRTDQEDSVSETVGKVAIGTAAGAILGRILGDDSGDALKGAAAGTVAGAVVAITTRDGHATIEKGSLMTIRLDEPVR